MAMIPSNTIRRVEDLGVPSIFHKFFLFSFLPRVAEAQPPTPVPQQQQPRGGVEEECIHRVLRYMDEDGDGKISPRELGKGLRSMGLGEAVSDEEVEAVVGAVDSDGDGLLDMGDLERLARREAEEEEEEGSLREAFGLYAEGDAITPRSLGRMLGRLGDGRWSLEQCEVMVRSFDLDGDGVVSYDEFKIMMEMN